MNQSSRTSSRPKLLDNLETSYPGRAPSTPTLTTRHRHSDRT